MDRLADALGLPSYLGECVFALFFAGLVGFAFAPLEILFPLRRTLRDRASLRTDALFATLGGVATQLALYFGLGLVLSRVLALATRAGLGAASPLNDAPAILTIALGLALVELAGYGYHRLAHRVPFLFRLHAVHHSAETMDWLASFRQHPLEIVLMTLAQNLPLVVLGVPLTDHALVILLLRVNTVFVHSNLRVPELLALLVATPSFHHRHHDRDREAKNFASVFPFIDRLFGTHDEAPAEAFGLGGTSPPSLIALFFGLGATGSRVSRRPRPPR